MFPSTASSFEQLVGSFAVGDGAVQFHFYAGNFAFKRLNSRLQFLNGIWVEILFAQ